MLLGSFTTQAQLQITGDTIVCEESHKTYSVNTIGSWNYLWTISNGASSLPTQNPTHVSWGGPGSGVVQVVIDSLSGGNHDTLYLNVSIKPKPTPKIFADKTFGCTTLDESGNIIPVSPECLTTCDSTWVTYHTKMNAGSNYEWKVIGTYLNTPSLTGNTISIHWGKEGSGKLIVTEITADSCSKTTEKCIEIIKRPNANFFVTPRSINNPHTLCLGTEVSFFDQSIGAEKWYWNFDDPASGANNYASTKTPKHIFNDPGTYVVSLVVENLCHCTDTLMYEFDVSPDISDPILCNGVVCANGSMKYYTPDASCNDYHWTVSANGAIVSSKPYNNIINVDWSSGPVGTVSLWTDCSSSACYDTVSITVQVIPETIDIEGDKTVCNGEVSKLWVHCMPSGTCSQWSDSFRLEVHAPPAAPVLSSTPSPACENTIPIQLSASVSGSVIQTNWSNGASGSPIEVFTKGLYQATVVDSLGCTNQDTIEVHGIPDMCYFMCGCYEFCDTITGGVWLPGIPGTYSSWSWMANGSSYSSGVGAIPPLDLYDVGGGEVYLIVTNYAGCSDTSCLFEYGINECEVVPCEGEYYDFEIWCEQPYDTNDWNYGMRFEYTWNGCPNSVIQAYSTTGIMSGFTGVVNPGANTIAGLLTFVTDTCPKHNEDTVCFSFFITDDCSDEVCKIEFCWDQWVCDAIWPPPEEGGRSSTIKEYAKGKGTLLGKHQPIKENYKEAKTELRVFPNPASDFFNVAYQCQSNNCSLEILNSQGVMVRTMDLPNASSQLIFNKAEISSGTYTFRLIDKTDIIFERVIILE